MKKQRLPLPLIYSWITGAIGKEFVIKHYKYGTVKTKYPDMTRMVASKAQCKCRNLFKEAVAYAQAILADPIKFTEWQKRTRKPKYRVFTQIIRYYILEAKEAIVKRRNATKRLIDKCFNPDHRKGVPTESKTNSKYELKEVFNDHHLLKREHFDFLLSWSVSPPTIS